LNSQERATQASWPRLSFDGPFVVIPWRAAFSEQQFELIRQGAIPEDMDDKWFAFFEEPELFLHRSWTGFLIYRVTFAREGDQYVAATSSVLDNKDRYRRKPVQQEVEFLDFLVHRLLLNEPKPFPGDVGSSSPLIERRRRTWFRWWRSNSKNV
jgi:hypothetical protein